MQYKHFWGRGGPEFWKTCLYNTRTLPKQIYLKQQMLDKSKLFYDNNKDFKGVRKISSFVNKISGLMRSWDIII